jgi:hypothetical protein
MPGLTVTACDDLSPCALGADGGVAPGPGHPTDITDGDGFATLSGIRSDPFGGRFAQYLVIRGPNIPVNISYLDIPPVTTAWMLRVIIPSSLHTPAPGRGSVMMIVRDCAGGHNPVSRIATVNAPGVRVSSPQSDAQTIVGYFGQSLGVTETRTDGIAGILNLPADGIAEIEATLVTTGQVIARKNVRVVAGAVTTFGLGPAPPGL